MIFVDFGKMLMVKFVKARTRKVVENPPKLVYSEHKFNMVIKAMTRVSRVAGHDRERARRCEALMESI